MPLFRVRLVRSLVLTLVFACLSATAASAAEKLVLGVHPYLSSSDLVKRFTPLGAYLARTLLRPVEIEVSSNYDVHIKKIGLGAVDIAFMGPVSYVKLTEEHGPHPILAAFKTRAGKVFHGRIMVRNDSPITSLAQLKGKRFVFGDHASTMSHFVPRHMLLMNGIDATDFTEVAYVANHDNIALAILGGYYDAGAVKEEVFRKYESQGLRSIARSAPVTDHVFIARNSLPRETVHMLKKALLDLDKTDEGRRVLAGLRSDVIGLAPAEDSDFDSLRSMVRTLRKAGIEP